jgi:NAD(P)H dehydrogenase (quinone)
MTKRIFIWVAHPKAKSLCEKLAVSYQSGVERNGAEVRRMNLSDMSFDMNFEGYDQNEQALEADLLTWQENVRWADHLFVVHPYWWGAMPTKAKAVIDRALTPGFGFNYHRKGVRWDKLLTGKTADAIITSDTPPLLDTFLYRKPARRVLKNQVLGFCGIETKKILQVGSVKLAGPEKIENWIRRAERMGFDAAA